MSLRNIFNQQQRDPGAPRTSGAGFASMSFGWGNVQRWRGELKAA